MKRPERDRDAVLEFSYADRRPTGPTAVCETQNYPSSVKGSRRSATGGDAVR